MLREGRQQPVLSCEQGTAPASILLLVFNMLGRGSILRMCNSISLHTVCIHLGLDLVLKPGSLDVSEALDLATVLVSPDFQFSTQKAFGMNDVLQMFRGVCVSDQYVYFIILYNWTQ